MTWSEGGHSQFLRNISEKEIRTGNKGSSFASREANREEKTSFDCSWIRIEFCKAGGREFRLLGNGKISKSETRERRIQWLGGILVLGPCSGYKKRSNCLQFAETL